MRYIGSKNGLTEDILNIIEKNAPDAKSVIDVFAGSGAVTSYLKEHEYKVISNDILYFSYVLIRGTCQLKKEPKFKDLRIKDPILYLNKLTLEKSGIDIKKCFIYQNYTPHKDCKRMYFQKENAIKIDIIRITIENWWQSKLISEDEYYYLLASLIAAVPFVSNIAGVYAAYLKFWDTRTFKTLTLEKPSLINSKYKIQAYNENCNDILKNVKADILYSDSPYNERQYLPNYHILETIAKYDYPKIHGITGIRDYGDEQKSDFCKKNTVHKAFEDMVQNANVKYIVISYNNEGLISTEELSALCQKYAVKGSFSLTEIPYRRYKSKKPNDTDGLKEQIYFFKKNKIQTYDKSPLNYIGGKYKMLPQIMPLFPKNINSMIDLFAGGCDVCSNISAKCIYANDINFFVIDIYKKFQNMCSSDVIKYIDNTIQEWGLSETNKDAYLKFREHYNKTKNPLDLYILTCFSFNHQIRFNERHEYNNPFGQNRSCFNNSIRANLIKFVNNIKGINFSSMDFRDFNINRLQKGDFIYCDPPYTITTGSYNDGKRGFKGWSTEDDRDLFELLDKVNNSGAQFALSNVIEHKGNINEPLLKWSSKYHVHHINYNYSNSNYHAKDTEKETKEVLITNY